MDSQLPESVRTGETADRTDDDWAGQDVDPAGSLSVSRRDHPLLKLGGGPASMIWRDLVNTERWIGC